MTGSKQEISVVISNLDNMDAWRKKEARFSANVILNQIKKELPPDQWRAGLEAVMKECRFYF